MRIGAQLYTVRDYTKDLSSFSQTLERIADIGYKVVQVSGTCKFEAEWLKNELSKNGLTCAVTHISADSIAQETDKVITDHDTFGCRYIGIGYLCQFKDGTEDVKKMRDKFMPAAKKFKENGHKLCLHNHQFEFQRFGEKKKTIIELLADEFKPDELSFILDTYWAQFAGADPAEVIRSLSGRVECVHLKDMAVGSDFQPCMTPIYEGNINFDSILKACEDSGTEYLLVEQDNTNGEDPFDCLRRSYENLKAKGLE